MQSVFFAMYQKNEKKLFTKRTEYSKLNKMYIVCMRKGVPIMSKEKIAYRRILLKLSGEALANGKQGLYDYALIDEICARIKTLVADGVQVGIVIGAGNIWRGRQGTELDRVRADHMGMLATVLNCLAVQDALLRAGVPAKTMTAIEMHTVAEFYTVRGARAALEAGTVLLFGCGTGSPFFSTDTGAVLRAAEIEADVVLMAKNVDAIYTADPKKDANAKPISVISYTEILEKGLKALDFSAAAMAMENGIPVHCFGLADPDNILRAVYGERIGTVINGIGTL